MTLPTTMHAIEIAGDDERPGPDALRWVETAMPAYGPDDVLIEVVAAGVNRADLMQRQGLYPPPPGASPVIGLECSGRVVAVGDHVEDRQVGEECVALLAGGGYAEYVAVPTGQVLSPPPGCDLVTAAGIVEVAATVWSNLTEAVLDEGETLLIHGGAGGIGAFAIQWGVRLGAVVHATAGTEEKRRICRELGAHHVWDHHDDWAEQVAAVGPVDVILDPIGAKYLATHVRLLGRHGRLVTIGFQGGRSAELDLSALLAGNKTVRATSLRNRPVDEKTAICAGLVAEVWDAYADGSIRPPSTTTIPMPEAGRAHALLESGAVGGKLVLTVPDRS